MKELLEAGVHFGHQTRRWNPKMKQYIFGAKNGIYIIDLQKTVRLFKRAYQFAIETVAEGDYILFVGTKRQAQESIQEEATRCGMPYVNQRWLGGMLTNFGTIRKGIDRLKDLEAMREDGRLQEYPKKEILKLQKEQNKLGKNLGGIKDMDKLPGGIFVVDSRKEYIAVREARKLGIPVLAIVDTNCDPDEIDFLIPGNDDAIRAIRLFARLIADACVEGAGLREERIRAMDDEALAQPVMEEKEIGESPGEASMDSLPSEEVEKAEVKQTDHEDEESLAHDEVEEIRVEAEKGLEIETS